MFTYECAVFKHEKQNQTSSEKEKQSSETHSIPRVPSLLFLKTEYFASCCLTTESTTASKYKRILSWQDNSKIIACTIIYFKNIQLTSCEYCVSGKANQEGAQESWCNGNHCFVLKSHIVCTQAFSQIKVLLQCYSLKRTLQGWFGGYSCIPTWISSPELCYYILLAYIMAA